MGLPGTAGASRTSPLWRLDWLYLRGRGFLGYGDVQWILLEETGFWSSPEPRVDVVERTNAHGAYIQPIYYKERVITLKFRAYCDNPETLRYYQTLVAGLCADPTRTFNLSCESEIGELTCGVRADGQALITPVPLLDTNAFEASVQLVAADPRKYSVEWTELRAGVPSATTGDGLVFTGDGLDFTDGLSFGTGGNASGQMLLRNSGTAPTTPVYVLEGPLTSPTLRVTQAARTYSMTYNASLETGEQVVIDPSAPSVLLGGTASRRWLLNPAEFAAFVVPPADPWTGQPGALSVGLTHQGGQATGGSVTACLRDAYF